MKNKILTIPYFLLWILYFILTLNKRSEYMAGQNKGMHCTKSYDSSLFIYGTETTYEFDPNKKPEREYITWNEFWKQKDII